MNGTLLTLAKHNYAALVDLSTFLSFRGFGNPEPQLGYDIAQMVHGVFESMSWADRRATPREYQFLDALFEADEVCGGRLREVIGNPPNEQNADEGLPKCVLAAAQFDRTKGTAFAEMIINHLDNLGYLILISDGSLPDVEVATHRDYFGQLRRRAHEFTSLDASTI